MLIHYLSLTLKNVCNSEFSKSKLVTLSFLFITTKITLFYVFVWIDTLIANCFPVVEMFLFSSANIIPTAFSNIRYFSPLFIVNIKMGFSSSLASSSEYSFTSTELPTCRWSVSTYFAKIYHELSSYNSLLKKDKELEFTCVMMCIKTSDNLFIFIRMRCRPECLVSTSIWGPTPSTPTIAPTFNFSLKRKTNEIVKWNQVSH